MDVALGSCAPLDIWGDDYDTRDGAGEGDCIHVSDIAGAHIAGARYLEAGCRNVVLNCGSGRAHTVLEVVAALEAIVGHEIPRRRRPRRQGDVASAVGDVTRMTATLDWRPRFEDLEVILRTALAWRGWSGC